ncbi:MAG TPA: hypothetical protein VFH06_04790 [Candidatus Saccharimonadales bacterium]|nr:hypothetical protein [Candidatus Saccharimonadales bacterium]
MRIGAMCFAQIRDEQGRYCLLLNKGRLKHSQERILSPVGGGIEGRDAGLKHLTKLGATDFESLPDLRFRIADEKVAKVEEWFAKQVDREVSVLRELREELGEETGVLSEDDMQHITEKFIEASRFDAFTKRRNVAEKKTAYLIEVFQVGFPANVMRKLLEAATRPIEDRWAYFVSREEIEKGETHDSVKIGPISAYIL